MVVVHGNSQYIEQRGVNVIDLEKNLRTTRKTEGKTLYNILLSLKRGAYYCQNLQSREAKISGFTTNTTVGGDDVNI